MRQLQSYKALKRQVFSSGQYAIEPIRYEDRMLILQWRNEQIHHLRQNKPLTEEDQENYFSTVVNKLFTQEQPDQLLFSYFEHQTCIGYGGLVHMNWIDKNAEISFIMNTALEKEYFSQHWKMFLKLIQEVAFIELKLHKIYTYAFDIRPHLYNTLEDAGFTKEAVLKNHVAMDGDYKDVVIHSKFNT
jgi:RimJ/RimL family protein N-acetyltransferase